MVEIGPKGMLAFFPADKVFAKAEKIFKGPITTMKIDSLHLPDEDTMLRVCQKTTDFFLTECIAGS